MCKKHPFLLAEDNMVYLVLIKIFCPSHKVAYVFLLATPLVSNHPRADSDFYGYFGIFQVSLPNYEEVEPTPEIAAQLGSTVAELTCPDYCVIKESKILNAGLGVFANIGLPTGICFGPYKGEISENKKMANKSGYAWEIRPRPGEQTRFIDGADPNKSNWLRYINGASGRWIKFLSTSVKHFSDGESQNLHAFQYRGQVFYEVFRPIEKGEELLGKFLFFIFST